MRINPAITLNSDQQAASEQWARSRSLPARAANVPAAPYINVNLHDTWMELLHRPLTGALFNRPSV
jgi:hypothetical protein